MVVVPQTTEADPSGLPLTEEETLARASHRARAMEEALRPHYDFFVATEGGLHSVAVEGKHRYFIRNWTFIVSHSGDACGGSGSVQLPAALVEGLGDEDIPAAVPATRRGGGMLRTLTGGLESRRSTVCASTVNALSTLFYGILETPHPPRRQF